MRPSPSSSPTPRPSPLLPATHFVRGREGVVYAVEHSRPCQFVQAALNRQQIALAVHGPCPDLHRARRLKGLHGLFDRFIESLGVVRHSHLFRPPAHPTARSSRAMIANIAPFRRKWGLSLPGNGCQSGGDGISPHGLRSASAMVIAPARPPTCAASRSCRPDGTAPAASFRPSAARTSSRPACNGRRGRDSPTTPLL